MTIKFNKNETYHVLRTLGIRADKTKDGDLKGTGYVLSESDKTLGEVTPEMELVFIGKEGGAPIFEVKETGLQVRSHSNHFNPVTGYNLLKGAPKGDLAAPATGGKAPSDRMLEYRRGMVDKARVELKKQEDILAGLEAQAKAAPPRNEASRIKEVLSPESDARKAARATIEALKAEAAAMREEVAENAESLPEPTADDIIDSIIAGETEDTTAPEAQAS